MIYINQKKIFILGIVSIFIIITSGFIVFIVKNPTIFSDLTKNKKEDPNYSPAITNLTMIIDFGNSTISNLSNLSMESNTSTVFDLLQKYYLIEYDSYSNGNLVTSINGIKNNANKNTFWFYWVNFNLVNIASSKFYLKSYDFILWNYTEYIY